MKSAFDFCHFRRSISLPVLMFYNFVILSSKRAYNPSFPLILIFMFVTLHKNIFRYSNISKIALLNKGQKVL